MDEKLRRLLGDAARAARLRMGLTQAEVAKKVRLKPGVYGRVERGAMVPSVPTLRRICETLAISSDALRGRRGAASRWTSPGALAAGTRSAGAARRAPGLPQASCASGPPRTPPRQCRS